MTWGSSCPQCGKDECGWTHGIICHGNLPQRVEELKRLRAERDEAVGLLREARRAISEIDNSNPVLRSIRAFLSRIQENKSDG